MLNAPSWAELLTFWLSALGATSIFALSAFSAMHPDFRFFPPPSKNSWQHKAFLTLFRIYLYPLIALSVLLLPTVTSFTGWAKVAIGLTLIISGFGMAFRITFWLGWRNAFGEKRGLITTGWFARSRNPIYVATWAGLIGWAMIISDPRVVLLLTLWGVMYLLAPFFEEPWLDHQYGDVYRAYKAQTRRFL